MIIKAQSPDEYIALLPEHQKDAILKLRKSLNDNIPNGFQETMSYNMIGYVVPHSLYPKGYHCDTNLPLPFISIAAQKNFIAVYHMGIYAIPDLYNWFVEQHQLVSKRKLDMGKSCIRYKKIEDIPFDLLGQLFTKLTPKQWIEVYEKNYLKSNKK